MEKIGLLVLFSAMVVEWIVELFSFVVWERKEYPKEKIFKAGICKAVSLVLSALLVWYFKINLQTAFGIPVSATVGWVFTTIVIAQGSDYAHNSLKRLKDLRYTKKI